MKRSQLKTDPSKVAAWQQRSRSQLKQSGTLKRTGFKSSGGRLSQKSKKQDARLEKYYPIRDAKLKAQPLCECCGRKAQTVHHRALRIGKNLYRLLMSICWNCHNWIHFVNSREAERLGYLVTVDSRTDIDEADYDLKLYPKE